MIIKFLLVLILTFSFQSWTKADDIRDFEIEGISVGDSLLSYLNKNKIKKIKSPNKKLKIVRTRTSDNLEVYDYLKLWWFDNDKDYKIVGIAGELKFDDNLKNCKKKQQEIADNIKRTLTGFTIYKSVNSYNDDKSGKSKVYHHTLYFDNKDNINIQCYKFSKNFKKKNDFIDHLKVMIVTNEMDVHYSEAYK